MTDQVAPKAMSVRETAQILGVSESKVREMVMLRKLPSLKVGGRRLIPVDKFNRWFNAQVVEVR